MRKPEADMLSTPARAEAAPYESASELRDAHSRLLDRLDDELGAEGEPQRAESEALAKLEAPIREFLARGVATGLFLDEPKERTACQVLLDYWASSLSRHGMRVGALRLARFDAGQLPDLADKPCPYVGLEAFRSRTFFFGREADTEDLLGHLQRAPLTIVVGASGSGKSSLVMGGVLPRMASGESAGKFRVLPPVVPAQALADLPAAEAGGSSGDGRADGRKPEPLLLTIDQFEEVFTLMSEPERESLASHLAALLDSGSGHRVILTLREEFRSRMVELRSLDRYLDQGWYFMRPMGYDELYAAVVKPAELVNLQFRPGIVDDLVKKVLGQVAALPLLQFTLRSLWHRRDRNRITWEVYNSVGDPLKALAASADAFYDGLAPEAQIEARRILLALVRVDELLEAYRQPLPMSTLLAAGKANSREIIRLLAENDYVRVSEAAGRRGELVEVKHEALVRNWPRFVGWIDEKRHERRQRLALIQAARRWAASGRPQEGLLTGWQLQAAETQADLSSEEAQFVAASRDAVQRVQLEREAHLQQEAEQARRLAAEKAQAARRFRWLAVFAAVAAAVAIVASTIAVDRERAVADAREKELRADSDIRERDLKMAVQQQKTAALAMRERELEANLKEAEQQRKAEALQAQLHTRDVENAVHLAIGLEPMYLDNQLDLALLLGVEANRVGGDPPEEVRHSLASALMSDLELEALIPAHTDGVTAVAFSPDGGILASGSKDSTILLWDVDNRIMTHKPLAGHRGKIYRLAFSEDGATLASASSDGKVGLWDVASGERLGDWLDIGSVAYSVAFSSDGKRLATCTADGAIRLWSIEEGKPRLEATLRDDTAPDGQLFFNVAFSPEEPLLVSGGNYARIVIWDLNTLARSGAALGGSKAASDQVFSIAFSHEGKQIAAGYADGRVELWDVEQRKSAGPLATHHVRAVTDLTFSPDDKQLVTVSYDRSVLIHQTQNPSQAAKSLAGYAKQFLSVDISADGRRVATGTSDHVIALWDLEGPTRIGEFLQKPNKKATRAAFVGPNTLVSDLNGRPVLSNVFRKESAPVPSEEPRVKIRLSALSLDRHHLVTVGEDNSISRWRIGSEEPPTVLAEAGESHVASVAVGPDGQAVAASFRHGQTHADVRLLRPGDEGRWKTLDRGTEEIVRALSFSPDGRNLAVGGRDASEIWDITGPQPIRRLEQKEAKEAYALAFSRTGKLLASGGKDGAITLWDMTSKAPPVALEYHKGPVNHVEFSPDGKLLASAAKDGHILLWDIRSRRRPIAFAYGHGRSEVISISFSPDSQSLVTSAQDGGIIQWPLNTLRWTARACGVAARNFTDAEWKLFFGDREPAITCPNALVKEADRKVMSGEPDQARRLFAAATERSIQIKDPLAENEVCWLGSLDGFATLVMPACEKAVETAPEGEKPQIVDSRGLARALKGDTAGAIRDFTVAVDSMKDYKGLAQNVERRRRWIAELQQGHNPFDATALSDLRRE